MTKIINNLSEISNNYDLILCDIWGVIHNGVAQYETAVNALIKFKQNGGKVVLISNAPRPSVQIPAQLEALGIGADSYDAIITSGDATIISAHEIGSKAYKIGGPKDDFMFKTIGAEYTDAQNAEYIICTGLRDDLNETTKDYIKELETLKNLNLTMICANPDKIVQYGDRLIECGGALAEYYENIGGKVIMAGKPYPPIYDLAFAAAGKFEKSRTLCIGDGINTDVRGAFNQQLDCIFVTGGIHAAELSTNNALDAKKTADFLNHHGLDAKYAIMELE